jgi:hypothetical protein
MKFSIYGKNMLNIERLAVEDFFRFGEGGDRNLIQPAKQGATRIAERTGDYNHPQR